jgi:phosphoribosyl 1,2-cyclic phosphodiesterase
MSQLQFNNFKYFSKINAAGLEVECLPVKHGEDLDSSAFIFGSKDRVVYISDISRMIPETLEIIKSEPVDVLVVDALCLTYQHPTHFSLEQAIELSKEVKAKRSFFVGMGTQFDHDEVNSYLATLKDKEGLDMQLAHDGLSVSVDLGETKATKNSAECTV